MKKLIAGLFLAACGAPSVVQAPSAATHVVDQVAVSPALQAIVDAPDRAADDRALDGGRHPGQMLAFFGIAPNMQVADLAAGNGYTTELLARAVGSAGKVYSQNNKFVLGFANDAWTARLATPPNKVVTRVERELDDPLPSDAQNLDVVLMVLFYHDTYWQKVDRVKMDAAIFAALKHGGVFGVVDHSAADGAGATQVDTLHRIEEREVIADVSKAGFTLESEASFLREPNDKRDWNPSPRKAGARRGTSDRFVLKFIKP